MKRRVAFVVLAGLGLAVCGGVIAVRGAERDWRYVGPAEILRRVRLGMDRDRVLEALDLPGHWEFPKELHHHRADSCFISLGYADNVSVLREQSEYTFDFDEKGLLTGVHRNRVGLVIDEVGEYILGSP